MVYNCSSILSIPPIGTLILSLLLLIILTVAVIRKYLVDKRRVGFLGLFLVLIGSIPIIHQRLLTGCVLDNLNFFDLFMFNVFDLFISIGTLILAYFFLV